MNLLVAPFRYIWRNLKLVVSTLIELNAEYAPLLARLKQAPGFTSSNPTRSYWLNEPPFPELVNIQSEKLPTEADIVIIGSGITGASVAWTFLEQTSNAGKDLSIVVLDARDICDGATGRNGGHIKPSSYQLFNILRKRQKLGDAAAVVRFQRMHIDCLVDLCEKEGFHAAECRKVETYDLFVDEKEFTEAKDWVRDLHKHLPDVPTTILEAKEAQSKCGTNEKICGALAFEAGALWPYRFVTSVWHRLLSRHKKSLHIETNTTVKDITVGDSSDRPYIVKTTRGDVSTAHVVHATNAFASQLLPRLRSKMTGIRAHMSAHASEAAFPDSHGERSWSFMYQGAYDYMTQRPGICGDLLLGGGFAIGASRGMNNVAVWEDDKVDAQTEAYLRGIVPTLFQKQEDPAADIAKCKQIWTGIVAVTGDFLPFVGKLDPSISNRRVPKQSTTAEDQRASPAEWIAAGYMGDGMVYAWLSGVAVALQILGLEANELVSQPGIPGGPLATWFPEAMRITKQRLDKVDITDIADML